MDRPSHCKDATPGQFGKPGRTLTRKGVRYTSEYTPHDGRDWYGRICRGGSWRLRFDGTDVVASVLRYPGSYGYMSGLYELAFIRETAPEMMEFVPLFEGDWGDEVIGYLSEEEVWRWVDRMLERTGLIDPR